MNEYRGLIGWAACLTNPLRGHICEGERNQAGRLLEVWRISYCLRVWVRAKQMAQAIASKVFSCLFHTRYERPRDGKPCQFCWMKQLFPM